MGDRPAVGGQLVKVPAQPDHHGVLLHGIPVLRPGHDASSGGDDLAGLLGDLSQSPVLPNPEPLLPFGGKDVWDGAARLFYDLLVHIGQRAAQLLGQRLANGGLSAAGHADEEDVFRLPLQLGGNVGHQFVGQLFALEPLRGRLGLGHQHPQAVAPDEPPALGLEKQLSFGGVINEVKDTLTLGELVQIHGGNSVARVHTHGGGVDDDLGIGVAVQILIVILSGTGDGNDLPCPQLREHRSHRKGGPAAAQHQGFPALHLGSGGL